MKHKKHPPGALIKADPQAFDAVRQTIENPPAPGPKLKALAGRVPTWKK